MEEPDWTFITRSLVRFSISGMIFHSINVSESFGYELNGSPQTHKAALCEGWVLQLVETFWLVEVSYALEVTDKVSHFHDCTFKSLS